MLANLQKTYGWLSLALIGLVVVSVLVMMNVSDEPNEKSGVAPVKVVRESFEVGITERGIVRPAKISPIKSQVSSNQAKIVWMIKEGSVVKEGDVVARFDTKPFLDELSRAERDSGDAQATLIAAQKLLLMQQEEEAGRIEEAERKVEIAGIDAQNIKEGAGPLERKQVEQRVKKAERGFRLAKSNYEDMEVLLKRGHASLRERDKASDELETAREQLNVAREELYNFDTYKWPKMIREAELLVNGASSELQRVKVTAELKIQNKRVQVEKSRRNVANREAVRKKAEKDLENCEVKAPADGILLYSVLPRETGRRKIQIGDSVWVGQTFLEVPDTSQLIVEVQIREIDVAKIAEGMPASVELDAFPGTRFSGVVEVIASLAEDDGKNSNIRRFYARIKLLEKSDNIHVGMSATAAITYHSVVDGLTVPVGAVMMKEGRTMVERHYQGAVELIQVELGARGVDRVEVLSGLKEGDLVNPTLY
ncbi:efflux RND transporter periplasmic adaptor subunit [Desulfopila sp. IMCC35008]|uniref:efflux RND transporter periplasmic adaptor subunit n=1 Tax=Desulfopila sp. IMCC35008 TaxID=2653858 RepID=UPI0013D17C96|nr:efflux RND transporter periplasmic adaptor subunit [Desulfopila sp. IMCC35008]